MGPEMDPEVQQALMVLQRRLSPHKMSVVETVVKAQRNSGLHRQRMLLTEARNFLDLEIAKISARRHGA